MAEARLEREDVLPPGLEMSHQLVISLQRAKALIARDGFDQGAQQSGLPSTLITRDHH
jgi:hypothetical protein